MKFDMGRAWSEGVRLLTANRDVVAIVAGVFFFLPYLALTLSMAGPASELEAAEQMAPEAALEQMMAAYSDVWWLVAIFMLMQGIGMLGLLALLTDHRRPTVGEALKFGATALLPYVGAQILQSLFIAVVLGVPVGLAIMTGSNALIAVVAFAALVGFFYLFIKFSLLPPVIAIEGMLNPLAALKRSWQLTKGNSLRLFLFYALLVVAMMVVFIVLSMIVGLILAVVGGQVLTLGQGIMASALNAAWVTLFLAILAGVHRQLAGASTGQLSETFE